MKKEIELYDRLPRTRKDIQSLWRGKLYNKETVPEFFERVWQKYVPLGLTWSLIKSIDPKYYAEINYYEKLEHAQGRQLPPEMQLPTQRSKLADLEKKFDQEGAGALTGNELDAVFRKKARDVSRGIQNLDKPCEKPTRPNDNRSRCTDEPATTPQN